MDVFARTSSSLLLLAVLLLPLTCGGGDPPEFGPQRDDAAMRAIEKCWLPKNQGGLVLSLEEDLDAAALAENGSCQVEHVVRAGGKGETHRGTDTGNGCGGCPMDVVAYVRGEAEEGPFDGTVEVTGQVILGSNYEADPYEFPYLIELDAVEGDTLYRIEGELYEDGTVRVSVTAPSRGDWSDPVAEHSLAPVDW
jgi:hypothetical protein